MSPDSSPQVRGRVVGPPLEEGDVDQLDELAREEREDLLVQGDEALVEDADEDFLAEEADDAGLVEDADELEVARIPGEDASETPGDGAVLEAPAESEPDLVDVALEEEAARTVELAGGAPEELRGYEDTFVGVQGEGGEDGVVAPTPYSLLRFVDVVMVLPSTNPVLVLEEAALPSRQLRIPIGSPEGVAIAYAARRLSTPKPLTHELMINLLESYALTIDAVRITEVKGASYSAELVCSGPAGSCTVACRPSDGVALALRQRLPAPILAAPEVLELAGVEAEPGS